MLARIVRSIFGPKENIEVNAKRGHSIVGIDGKRKLEIDIFLPSQKLGFEYQVEKKRMLFNKEIIINI